MAVLGGQALGALANLDAKAFAFGGDFGKVGQCLCGAERGFNAQLLFDPNFFVSYLISIAVFGLFQAMYMANAGGAWDNAKKVVEVDLKEKNTDLHAATVVGDTVGDPYKDTSSVALNPIIKFSTLFGLLAAEISIHMIINARETGATNYSPYIGVVFLLVGLFFVYRSFYGMRIKK